MPEVHLASGAAAVPLRLNVDFRPTNERIEVLRAGWFNAPDLTSRQKICEQIELQAFRDISAQEVCWRVRRAWQVIDSYEIIPIGAKFGPSLSLQAAWRS